MMETAMTNDLATKMAALTAELGKLAAEHDGTPPGPEQQAIVKQHCTSRDVRSAITICLAMLVETSEKPGLDLSNLAMMVAQSLTLLHKDAGTRRVTAGEVLRYLATVADRQESGLEELLNSLKRALGVKDGVVQPADGGDAPPKPGSN
jgi:hypothetical protein